MITTKEKWSWKTYKGNLMNLRKGKSTRTLPVCTMYKCQSITLENKICIVDSLDHVSAGGSLPRLGLVTEGWDPGAEPAVVRVIVTALLFGFFEQPCSVSSQGLVPRRNIILGE